MNHSSFHLTDKIAVVTGGGTGLGFGIAKAFVEAGSKKVVITGRRERILQDACKQLCGHADYIVNDVNDLDTLPGLVEQIETRFGPVDILVNNAGIIRDGLVIQMSDEDWTQVVQTNLTGTFAYCRAAALAMMKKRTGSIINVSSTAIDQPAPRYGVYAMTKAAVAMMTKTLAIELGRYGILVNAVAPGFVATRMSVVDGKNELESDWFRDVYVKYGKLPLRRFAEPWEFARHVAWLASDENTYLTGQVVTVDGGLTVTF